MKFDFLQQFPARMKVVGINSLLVKNSMNKQTWGKFGLDGFDEQMNVIFAVLLYIMEQSLRDDICTMDDIASFLDELNMTYLKTGIGGYDRCKELGEFIVNVVLCDEGRAMYFDGFNFAAGEYEKQHISYVANTIVYQSDDVRRTSYYLTDDGYNLMLSTLEVESNMKLTIQEMIFKLHLEKATYDKAADDIKNVFNMLRIQFQKIQEAMRKIRQNALRYAVSDYKALLEENLNAIEDTRKRFNVYRERVGELVRELTDKDIHVQKLEPLDRSNLMYLEIIEDYLNRALEEHQRILTSHFDMKALYTKELESLSQMAMIKRFDLRGELDEPLLGDAGLLENMDIFLRPLFNQPPEKVYNLNLAFQKQQPLRKGQLEEEEVLDFSEEEWQSRVQEEKRRRLALYHGALEELLTLAEANGGSITLGAARTILAEDWSALIPTVEIFKEVIIELLKSRVIDLRQLRQERQENLADQTLEFQVNRAVLEVFDKHPGWQRYDGLYAERLEEGAVSFAGVMSDTGQLKRIRCSDVLIQLVTIGESTWRMN